MLYSCYVPDLTNFGPYKTHNSADVHRNLPKSTEYLPKTAIINTLVFRARLTVSLVLGLSRVQTDRFQVPTTGTGRRLPETGQCVLSSGSRF